MAERLGRVENASHPMKERPVVAHDFPAGLSPSEVARYTKELVDSLREMALAQRHVKLAELLAAASVEAEQVAASSPDQSRA
jgi:hypothetical protein